MPTKTINIRVSLAGTLENAAREIDRLAGDVRERADWHPEGDEPDPCEPGQPDYYAAALRKIVKHARGVLRGEHGLAEFADFYCLTPQPARCEVCDWPLAYTENSGCVPGNCCYRPREGTDEYRRIEARRKALAEANS